LNLAEIADGPLIVHRGIRRGTEKSVHLRLFRRGRATLDILKRIEEEGRSPNILMECSSSEAVKAAVMRGLGLGILIQAHLENEIRRGEVKILKISECDDFLVPSFVIYQKDKPLSDNAKEFLRLLKRSARLSAQREIRSPSTNHISA
jgi:DNA-binding transcriptional LysR family regulator